MIIRFPVSGVRSMGRNTQGVRLINIDPADRVVATIKVSQTDEGEDTPDSPEDGTEAETVDSQSQETATDDTVH
jgi:DNA gyrase subunit A